MTACVNNTEKKAKGGVFQSKVLRAAMAGVLAIGLMPTVSGQAWAAEFGIGFEGEPAVYDGNAHTVTVDLTYTQDVSLDRTVTLTGDNGYESEKVVEGGWTDADGQYTTTVKFAGVKDAGKYTVTSEYVDVQGDPQPDTFSGASTFTVADADADRVVAKQDGTVIGWTGGDQTELASSTIVASLGEYELVQGTEGDVNDGKADYWVTWNDKVIGSNEADTTYEATVHLSSNFDAAVLTDVVELTVLAADPQTADEDFEKGTVTAAVDNNGASVSAPYEFSYDGGVHYVEPTELTTASGIKVDLTAKNADGTDKYAFAYYKAVKNADGNWEKGSYIPEAQIQDAGTYIVSFGPAAAGTTDYGQYTRNTLVFTINPATFDGTEVVDAYAPELTWNGQDHIPAITFEKDGVELVAGQDYDATKTIWYQADGEQVATTMVDAGKYVAKLTGVNNYAGSTIEIPVTIAPMDLASTTLSIADLTEETSNPKAYDLKGLDVYAQYVDVDGAIAQVNLKGMVELAITSGQELAAERGAYTVSATPVTGVTNVTGTGSASFAIVGETVDNFQYKGTPFADVANVVFNIDRGEALDLADIAVYDNDGNKLDSSEWTPVVTDAETGAVVTDYATRAGKYIMTVTVNYGEDYAMGGKDSFAFSVTAGSLAESDVFVTFDGKVCGDKNFQFGTLYWNGEDQSSRFGVKVQKDGKSLTEGTDYEWYFTDADGKRVDSLTNPGTYALHVDGIAWAGEFTMVKNIVVEELPITVSAAGQKTFAQRGGNAYEAYPYTGEVVEPSFGWDEKVADAYYDGLNGVLDPSEYTVQYYKLDGSNYVAIDADEIVAEGYYKATIALTEAGKAKFDLGQNQVDVLFQVDDKVNPFSDVTADQWYAERVAEAYAAWYINGYAGTDFFGPDNAIKRGDVACILFNVAVDGGVADLDHWMNASATTSSFDDVAAGDYWTAAINWAASAQVVNGYEGTSLFDPEANITREAFASMLANYAKATKDYVAPTTDISGMPGADGVSGWALENVQWAVENGIMGNNGADLNAQGTITRAEVAAMVMNFTEKF